MFPCKCVFFLSEFLSTSLAAEREKKGRRKDSTGFVYVATLQGCQGNAFTVILFSIANIDLQFVIDCVYINIDLLIGV